MAIYGDDVDVQYEGAPHHIEADGQGRIQAGSMCVFLQLWDLAYAKIVHETEECTFQTGVVLPICQLIQEGFRVVLARVHDEQSQQHVKLSLIHI